MKTAKVALATLLFWMIGAAVMPVMQDEAYYFAWARWLDFGYFDHPPLVAWMSQGAPAAAGSIWLARRGTLVVAALTMAATMRFLRTLGGGDARLVTAGLLLSFGSVIGLGFGFLTTPDTGLMLAWVLALTEAGLALTAKTPRANWRWLSAGFMAGLGILAKYTMVLIGPVFLWALIAQWRRHRLGKPGAELPQLKTPWPYFGGLVCLLVVAPNLRWNAAHDWITLRFQLHHGLSEEHLDVGGVSNLPRADEPEEDGPEVKLAANFTGLEEAEKKEEKAPRPYDAAVASLNRYFGFYGSQIGLWGAAGVAALILWRRRWQTQRRGNYLPPDPAPPRYHPGLSVLLWAAAVVPLALFGVLSLFTKVEANWSAMYVFGAAALIAPKLTGGLGTLAKGVAINALLLGLLLVHAQFGLLPIRPHKDRLLAETHGYPDVARVLKSLDGPMFADSYQLTAMMDFYAPRLHVRQWPGITRDSEFIRSPHWADVDLGQLQRQGFFWLVTNNLLPPLLSGFVPDTMAQLRDCKDEGLQVISAPEVRLFPQRCRKPIHEWYLIHYVSISPPP